jgi:hypothetical protein
MATVHALSSTSYRPPEYLMKNRIWRGWGVELGGAGGLGRCGGMAAWRHGGQQGNQRVQVRDQGLNGRAGRHDCLPVPCPRRRQSHWENPPIVEKPSEPHFIDFMGLPGKVDNFKICFPS